ncbi:excalibur calcium-binding domain-containing protein [Saccharopolyspora sp. NPDC000995]
MVLVIAGIIMLVGMAATVAMSIILWQQKAAGRTIWPWLVVGLLTMCLWPISLWVAIGLWWYWRATPVPPAAGRYPQVIPAQAPPVRRGARGPLISVACVLGSLITIVLFSALLPPVPAQTNQATPANSTVPPSTSQLPPSASQTPRVQLPPEAVVRGVLDADRVSVQIAGQAAQQIRIAGVDSPTTGADPECWGTEAEAFTEKTLLGQTVRVQLDSAWQPGAPDEQAAAIFLSDGANYSRLALEQGFARLSVNAPAALIGELSQAETNARNAQVGLWGAPCFGALRLAPPPPPLAPEPQPQLRSEPEPEPEPEPSPEGDSGQSPVAYYPSCKAAKAAGVAPLHRGDPGYSSKLDRDGDGVACES